MKADVLQGSVLSLVLSIIVLEASSHEFSSGIRWEDLYANAGFIHIREMSGKFGFFQGQGIVREFCDVSGKNEFLQKYQGILHFSLMKLGCLVPMYLSC